MRGERVRIAVRVGVSVCDGNSEKSSGGNCLRGWGMRVGVVVGVAMSMGVRVRHFLQRSACLATLSHPPLNPSPVQLRFLRHSLPQHQHTMLCTITIHNIHTPLACSAPPPPAPSSLYSTPARPVAPPAPTPPPPFPRSFSAGPAPPPGFDPPTPRAPGIRAARPGVSLPMTAAASPRLALSAPPICGAAPVAPTARRSRGSWVGWE